MKQRYNVVQFSPTPEFGEFVNIALLLFNGTPQLIFDDEFPKLKCIDPTFDRAMLRLWLRSLEGDLEKAKTPEEAEFKINSSSAQFRVGRWGTLTRDATRSAIDALMLSYLTRRKPDTAATLARGPSIPAPEPLIDRFLNFDLHLATENFMKQAEPSTFLSTPVLDSLGPDGFAIPRVASGKNALVLIDGLNLAANVPRIEKRAREAQYRFFRLRELGSAIRKHEHRDLVTASIIFNARRIAEDNRIKFSVHGLRHESNILVEADNSSNRNELRDVLLRAGVSGSLEFRP